MESLQQIEKELLPYQLEVKPTAYNLRRILSALNVETLWRGNDKEKAGFNLLTQDITIASTFHYFWRNYQVQPKTFNL